MHFVKSSVYQAEITEGGVREREVDTRSREEVELQERLRRLPEFSRNPNFKSYAEQVLEGLPPTTPEPPPPTEGKQNPNLPHSVTEEEFEFYEALRAQDRRKKLARQKEEDEMRDEFHKAREASLKAGSSVSSSRSHRSTESDGSLSSGGKPSPFALLGVQKQKSKMSSPFGSECIFDVTTKVYQEKQKKRALQVHPSFSLIVKKAKPNETAASPAEEKAADTASAEKVKAAAASGDESSPKDAKTATKNSESDTKEEETNVFASLCEAYGDSDSSG